MAVPGRGTPIFLTQPGNAFLLSSPLRSRSPGGPTRIYLSSTRRCLSFVPPFALPRWHTRCRRLEAMTPGPSSPCSAPPLLPVPPGLPAASAAPREIRSDSGTDAASRNRHRERKRQNHAPRCGRRGKPGRGRNAAEEKPEQLPQPFPGPFPAPPNLIFSWGVCVRSLFVVGAFWEARQRFPGKAVKRRLCARRQEATRNKTRGNGGEGEGEPRHF